MKTKILMIDDDVRYLELMQTLLEGDSYDVIISSNGSDLGRLIERHQPEVLILDVLIEEHNGVELAHEYRQTQSNRDLPIIFVSAWTGAGELKLPKNSHKLFKPFTRSELVSLIETSLGRSAVTVD